MSAVIFTPPEFASNFTALWEGYRSDSEHITFAFMSGFVLKIWAQEAELFIDPKVICRVANDQLYPVVTYFTERPAMA